MSMAFSSLGHVSPVQREYTRMVISITLARPMRSPKIPKNNPPVAQPTMKMEVAYAPNLSI